MYRSLKMREKQVFFLDIIGRYEAFSENRFQANESTNQRYLKLRSHRVFFMVTWTFQISALIFIQAIAYILIQKKYFLNIISIPEDILHG